MSVSPSVGGAGQRRKAVRSPALVTGLLVLAASGFTALYHVYSSRLPDAVAIHELTRGNQAIMDALRELLDETRSLRLGLDTATMRAPELTATAQPDIRSADDSALRSGLTSSDPDQVAFRSAGEGDAQYRLPMQIASPTPQQQEIFLTLKRRFDDPEFVRSLNLVRLMESPEMQAIPESLRMVIMSKAADRYNSGEVDRDVFITGMPLER